MKKRLYAIGLVMVLAASMLAYGETTESTDAGSTDIVSTDTESVQDEVLVNETETEFTDAEEENPFSMEDIQAAAEEVAPTIDLTDCYTFTDLLNEGRVSVGMGYTNIDIGDTNCFLVTSGTYDDLEGHTAAIDATVFTYKDGEIYELGKLASGGTAYPISTKDGYLYAASNYCVCKYVIADDKLQIMEMATVSYDTDGNDTYFYESEDGGDEVSSADAQAMMKALYQEMADAEVISFDTVTE